MQVGLFFFQKDGGDTMSRRPSAVVLAASLVLVFCLSAGFAHAGKGISNDLDAAELNKKGEYFYNAAKYSEAEEFFKRSLEIREKKLGPDHLDVALSLNSLALVYKATGRYAEAEPLYNRSLEIRESKLGKDHPAVAVSLNNLAELYRETGRYAEAVPLYKRSLEIRESKLGPDHLEVAVSLNNLALVFKTTGRYAEAEPLYNRSLEIRESKLGKDHPAVAVSLNNLAELYRQTGRYEEAEPLYKRSLEIRETKLGKDHLAVAVVLNNLAILYETKGLFAEAEPLYKRSLEIRKAKLGPNHPDVAQSLNNLATLYKITCRYTEAELLYKRSVKIRETTLGKDHPALAVNLNNLAELYRQTARYVEAEPLYKRSLEIRESKLGKDHPEVAVSLNSLAELYGQTSRYAEAEPLYKRSLEIRESKLGKDHPEVAASLNSLAELYRLTGRYAEAEPLYKRSLEIYESKLGKDHPAVAGSLNNLALLYRLTRRSAEAERLYRRSLEIRESKLGKDHPAVALSLNNIAVLYAYAGRYSEAEPLYKRSLEIAEAKLGKDHPNLAMTLNNLSFVYRRMGRYEESETLIRRSLGIAQTSMVPNTLRYVQDNYSRLLEKVGRLEAAVFYGKQAVNTVQGLRQNVARIDKETLDAFQGTVTGIYKHLSDLLIQAGRLPEAQQVMELLKQEEYFEFVQRDAREEDVLSGRATFSGLEAALEARYREAAKPLAQIGLERGALSDKKLRTPKEDARLTELDDELATAGEAFQKAIDEIDKELSHKRPDKVEQIKEAQGLQEDLRELGPGTAALFTLVGEEKYHVLLITPDFRKAFEVPITAADLNRKIIALRRALGDPRSDPRPPARALYDTVMAPVAPDLEELHAQTLMWSLDGALRYVPVAALYDGEHYLAEKYRCVIFTPASQARLLSKPSPHWKALGLGVSKAHPGFDSLPSVQMELSGIIRTENPARGVLPGLVNMDDAFTLEAMKEELHKRYPLVHIASHFHFTPGDDTKSFLLLGDGKHLSLGEIKVQNNLFGGVELLTLSACNTAVGDGMQNAQEDKAGDGKEVESFGVLAQRQGAKSVLATLWSVADESTGIFMQNFYLLREKEQLTKAEALQRTQTAFIRGRVEEASANERKTGAEPLDPEGGSPAVLYSHPYFWAPFILMGNSL
jgi:CHAT domain-containing protein/Tfp pilus assembly protein PilF